MSVALQLEAALFLAGQGFAVFPCEPPILGNDKSGKAPIGALVPNGFKQATTDPGQISAWWRQVPSANVGVVPGPGFGVFDIDPRKGGSLAQLGDFEPTCVVRTGGDGWHVWFRLPEGHELQSVGAGIDKRHNGSGYVVAPGSIHWTGKPYLWEPWREIAPAPARLIRPRTPRTEVDVARMLDEDERRIDDGTLDAIAGQLEPHLRQKGQRHDVAKNLGGWLKQRGWGPSDVRALVERLPSTDPEARVRAALAAFDIAQPFGWTELSRLLGEHVAHALDAATPNPKRTEDQAYAAIVARAVATQAPSALPLGSDPLPWVDADTLFKPLPPIPYVVPRLCICPGAPILVAGYGSAGKTMAAQQLAIDVALGRPAWGAFPVLRTGPVAHLDYEQGRLTLDRYQRFIRASGVQPEVLAGRIAVSLMPPMYLDSAQAEAVLSTKLTGFALAIVDSFRGSAPSTDENSSEVRRVLDMLGRVSERTGAAIILIHHARKPSREQGGGLEMSIRGSSGFFDGSGSVLILEGQDGQPTRVRHARARASGQTEPDFTLTTDDPGGRGVGLRVWASAAPSVESKRAGELAAFDQLVLEVVRRTPGLPTKGVGAQLELKGGGGFTKAGNALERLRVGGLVVERPGARNAKQWYAVSSPALHDLSASSPRIAQSSSPPLHPPIGVGGEDHSFGGIE